MLTIIGRGGVYSGTEAGWDATCARASGRRHYNAVRQAHALERRAIVQRLWAAAGGHNAPWGTQRRIATALGVGRATISRDLRAVVHPSQTPQRCRGRGD
jgi:DNA invertase Pin-like site-specific DNA recombinase